MRVDLHRRIHGQIKLVAYFACEVPPVIGDTIALKLDGAVEPSVYRVTRRTWRVEPCHPTGQAQCYVEGVEVEIL